MIPMPSNRKPKLIPLKELRVLCKEAGVGVVEIERRPKEDIWWRIERNNFYAGRLEPYNKTYGRSCRQNLKAFCLGLIQMKKDGEL